MSDIRFLNGLIEINYEPVAKIIEGKDWKTVEQDMREALEPEEDELSAAYEQGVSEGACAESNRMNDAMDRALDKLLKEGIITEDQHDKLCESLPS